MHNESRFIFFKNQFLISLITVEISELLTERTQTGQKKYKVSKMVLKGQNRSKHVQKGPKKGTKGTKRTKNVLNVQYVPRRSKQV